MNDGQDFTSIFPNDFWVIFSDGTDWPVYRGCDPDIQLPLHDGLALHHRTHWVHWNRVCHWANGADWQVRKIHLRQCCLIPFLPLLKEVAKGKRRGNGQQRNIAFRELKELLTGLKINQKSLWNSKHMHMFNSLFPKRWKSIRTWAFGKVICVLQYWGKVAVKIMVLPLWRKRNKKEWHDSPQILQVAKDYYWVQEGGLPKHSLSLNHKILQLERGL